MSSYHRIFNMNINISCPLEINQDEFLAYKKRLAAQAKIIRDQIRFLFLKRHGICVHCGQRDAVNGTISCEICGEKIRRILRRPHNVAASQKRYRETYWRRKNAGLCVRCGKPAVKGKTCCEICLEKYRQQARDTRARKKQCPVL